MLNKLKTLFKNNISFVNFILYILIFIVLLYNGLVLNEKNKILVQQVETLVDINDKLIKIIEISY